MSSSSIFGLYIAVREILGSLPCSEDDFGGCHRDCDQVTSRRMDERAMSRHLLEKLFSGQLGNGLFCPGKDLSCLLQAVIFSGEKSQIDKAVFSLNGDSCLHQIRIGMIRMRGFSDAPVIFTGEMSLVTPTMMSGSSTTSVAQIR